MNGEKINTYTFEMFRPEGGKLTIVVAGKDIVAPSANEREEWFSILSGIGPTLSAPHALETIPKNVLLALDGDRLEVEIEL